MVLERARLVWTRSAAWSAKCIWRAGNGTGKGASGMDTFSSVVSEVHMELGSKPLNFLRIKTYV